MLSFTHWFGGTMCLPALVLANGITLNGTTATGLSAEPGGGMRVTVAPATDGVSINGFDRFNVDAAGVVFDNQAALATTIVGNVTGGQRSLIEGSMSVEGERPDLIIANPAGITINGARFENMRALTLVTGEQASDTLSFDIRGGDILVGEEGLVADIRRLDLVAQEIAVDGPVSDAETEAPFLRIGMIAGIGRATIDPDVLTVSDAEYLVLSDRGGTASGDTLTLGAGAILSGGRVTLIADARGAGVNLTGRALAAEGGFTLTADGAIRIAAADIDAETEASITGDALRIDDSSFNAGDLAIAASRRISVTDTEFVSRGAVTVSGESLHLTSQRIRSRLEAESGRTSLSFGGDFVNRGGIVSGSEAGSTGLLLDVGGDVTLVTLSEDRIASIFASSGSLIATVGGNVRNESGRILGTESLSLTAGGDVENLIRLKGQGARRERSTSFLGSREERIFGGETYAVGAEVGQIAADGALAITAERRLENFGLIAGTDVRLEAKRFTNSLTQLGTVKRTRRCILVFCRSEARGALSFDGGKIDATGDLTLIADRFDNRGAALAAGTGISLTADEVSFSALTFASAYIRPAGLRGLFRGQSAEVFNSFEGGEITTISGDIRIETEGEVVFDGTAVGPETALVVPPGFRLIETPEAIALPEDRRFGLFAVFL